MPTNLSPLRVPLFTAATTATNGTSQWIDVSGYTNLCFYLKTNGSPGAGTCVLEESDFDGSQPAREAPSGLTASALATVTITSGVGNSSQAAFHYSGAFHFVRARIGTTVTSTTLDGVLVAS